MLAACLSIAVAHSQTSFSTVVSASVARSTITSFAKTSGQLFEINGQTQYFTGTNSYWIGFLTNNADVDLVMSHIASVRTISYDGHPH